MPKQKMADAKYGKNQHIWGKPVTDERELETLKKIGETLQQLRYRRGESQQTFGENFAIFVNRKKPYHLSTVACWERGILPNVSIQRKICEYYGVEYEVLGCGETKEVKPYNMEHLDETINELKALSHMPVWCEFNECTHEGSWAIVDATRNRLVFSATKQVSFENINFNILKRPPDYIHSAESTLEPLEINDIYDTVWIEPKRMGYSERHKSMEWATNYEILNAYISDSGIIYPHAENGITYRAYKDLN